LVPGAVSISFRGWKVPTLGQQARDPIEAPDGSLWWAGHWGNVVGRIDPRTGEIKEFQLPARSEPHSITSDEAGNIWYMGNGNGTVGKLDPKSGKITVYELPDPRVNPERKLDPHTPVFRNGILFFTVHSGNMAGRLNPATGDIKLIAMPKDIRPYDIKVGPDGALWMGCNRPICSIYRMDPETMALREYPLPRQGTLARRIAFTSDGILWFANTGLGSIGRLDLRTGAVKEWQTPSGPKSAPYALEVVDDIVWFNESGKRPDPLVRFDPKTERFQSWPIPSTDGVYGGLLRNMMVTRDGNLVIHTGSTNEIVLVTLNGK
jgi:virginiamycin B lyase